MPEHAVERLQHRLGPRAHAVVVRQVPPADGAGGVDQELGRAGDAGGNSFLRLVEVVAMEDLGFFIAQEGIGPARLREVLAQGGGRIGADGDDTDAALVEVWKALLETP
jgi:hypothetical protein